MMNPAFHKKLRCAALSLSLLASLVITGNALACDPPGTGNPGCNGVANPINVITGNKYQRETDLPALPGVLGLEIVRHYNSGFSGPNNATGVLGRGWKLSYETEISISAYNIQITQADGTVLDFGRDPLNPKTASNANPANGRLNIHATSRGDEVLWTKHDGSQYSFNSQGKLSQILAPTGEFVSLQHDAKGWLVKVTDPQGRSLNLNYLDKSSAKANDRFRGVQSINSPVGQFSYQYGSPKPKGSSIADIKLLPNLVAVIYPSNHKNDHNSKDTTEPQSGRQYHYEDAQHPTLLTGISIVGNSENNQAAIQRYATFGYQQDGKAILSTHAGNVDKVTLNYAIPNQTTITNSLGQTTLYKHSVISDQYRLTEVRGAGCALCGEPNIRYSYDPYARLTSTTQLTPKGEAIASIQTELDYYGRPLTVKKITYVNAKANPAQLLARYVYSSNLPQPSLIARPSVVPGKELITKISYNQNGQPISITDTGWSPGISNKAQPTEIERSTRYAYTRINGKSLLSQIDGPLANGKSNSPLDSDITEIKYDRPGRFPIEIIAPGGFKTNMAKRDVAGKLLQISDASGIDLAYEFDPLGHIIKISKAGNTEERRYDAHGQLASVRRSNGQGMDFNYGADGQLADLFDTQKNRIRINRNTEREVTGRELIAADGSVKKRADSAEESAKTDFTPPKAPDLASDLANTNGMQSWTSKSGQVHQRWFDDFGRVIAIQNPVTGLSQASYDNADHIIAILDAAQFRQRLQWDLSGRLTGHWIAAHGQTEQLIREMSYDGTHLIRARSAAATEERQYDKNGRLTQQIRSTAGHTYVNRFEYDSVGNLHRQLLPDGSHLSYQWQDGKLTDMAVNGQSIVKNVRYAPATAMPVAYQLGATQVQWQQDQSGQLLAVVNGTHRYAVGQTGSSVMQALEQTNQTGLSVFGVANAMQLPATTPNTPPMSVLEKKQNASGNGRSSSLADSIDPAVADGLERDGRGLPSLWHDWQLSYDGMGRLDTANKQGASLRYGYDAFGAQVQASRQQGGTTSLQRIALYDEYRRTLEADSQGRITAQTIYLPAPGTWRPVARLTAQGLEVLFTDARGALTEARTLDGDVTWHAELDARGGIERQASQAPGNWYLFKQSIRHQGMRLWQRLTSDMATANISKATPAISLRLPGQTQDPDTALYYNFHRNYDPATGTYLEADPTGLEGGEDPYAYAEGQPLKYVDPWGLAKIQYFLIDSTPTDGANSTARWSFFLSGLTGSNATKNFLYDGGAFLGSSSNPLLGAAAPIISNGTFASWTAGNLTAANLADPLAAFMAYYVKDMISPPTFNVDISDVAAALLVKNLNESGNPMNKYYASACVPPGSPAGTQTPYDLVFPSVKLGAVTLYPGGVKSQNDSPTNASVPQGTDSFKCDVAMTPQREFQRIKDALVLQESGGANCSSNGCPAGTQNPSGTQASYGPTQFVVSTMVETLVNYEKGKTSNSADLYAKTLFNVNSKFSAADRKTLGFDDASGSATQLASWLVAAQKRARSIGVTTPTPTLWIAQTNSVDLNKISDATIIAFAKDTGFTHTAGSTNDQAYQMYVKMVKWHQMKALMNSYMVIGTAAKKKVEADYAAALKKSNDATAVAAKPGATPADKQAAKDAVAALKAMPKTIDAADAAYASLKSDSAAQTAQKISPTKQAQFDVLLADLGMTSNGFKPYLRATIWEEGWNGFRSASIFTDSNLKQWMLDNSDSLYKTKSKFDLISDRRIQLKIAEYKAVKPNYSEKDIAAYFAYFHNHGGTASESKVYAFGYVQQFLKHWNAATCPTTAATRLSLDPVTP